MQTFKKRKRVPICDISIITNLLSPAGKLAQKYFKMHISMGNGYVKGHIISMEVPA